MIIVSATRYIVYISVCYVGSIHDYRLMKQEFPPELGWFVDKTIWVDTGYQGIVKDYQCKAINIPDKKPRGGELTPAQKEANKKKSSERIYVEHSIGGIKRYRILADRLRMRDIPLYNRMLGVCSGLWNFMLSH